MILKKLQLIVSLMFVLILTACASKEPVLGVLNGKFKPCPDKPNCVNSQVVEGRHAVSAIRLTASANKAKELVLSAIAQLDGQVMSQADNYIRAQFTSRLFRFVDDIEFYLTQDSGATLVHVRSASRLGYSDLGVNRERVEEIRELLASKN